MLMCVVAERVARLEKEAQSLKRVSEEVFRVQKQIDSEKLARESASGQLQSDLQQLLSKLPATASFCKQRTPPSSCFWTGRCVHEVAGHTCRVFTAAFIVLLPRVTYLPIMMCSE